MKLMCLLSVKAHKPILVVTINTMMNLKMRLISLLLTSDSGNNDRDMTAISGVKASQHGTGQPAAAVSCLCTSLTRLLPVSNVSAHVPSKNPVYLSVSAVTCIVVMGGIHTIRYHVPCHAPLLYFSMSLITCWSCELDLAKKWQNKS